MIHTIATLFKLFIGIRKFQILLVCFYRLSIQNFLVRQKTENVIERSLEVYISGNQKKLDRKYTVFFYECLKLKCY